MAVINTTKLSIDLPVFEPLRDAPGGNSSALSSTCAALNPILNINFGRYIYYLTTATSFWRYDTWTDTYIQLQNPPIAPATYSTMRFGMIAGVENNVISASANTLYIPAYSGKTMIGYDVSIVAGTGAGQRRTIVDVLDANIEDIAVATAVSNTQGTITFTDATKNWPVNRWVGYQARIVQGSGLAVSGQARRILTCSGSVLTFGDSNLAAYEVFCNPAIFSPAIASTAGAQTVMQIEASTVILDNPWSVIPDTTSRYRVEGGGIYLISSAATDPFYTFQHYDVLSDTWYIRSAVSNMIPSVATNATSERTPDAATIWERGQVTIPATTNTITDSGKSWYVNQWAPTGSAVTSSYYVRITGGQGEGQLAKIFSNTATTLTFESMSVAPGTGSKFMIDGFDAGFATSGASGSITDTSKNWPINRWKNYALRIVSGSGTGQVIPISSNTSNTINLYQTSSVVLNNTTRYVITGDGDKLYTVFGGHSYLHLLNLGEDMAAFARREDGGTVMSGSVRFGSNRPIGINAFSNVGTTATVTTAVNHNLRAGQLITVRGATDANFNVTNVAIASTPTLTTLTYVMGGTPASTTVANGVSTTVLVDATKNWQTNEWRDYIVHVGANAMVGATGVVGSGFSARIASNTATTLTYVTPHTLVQSGVSRYVITKPEAIGSMYSGFASGSVPSTTTLQDLNVFFSGSASIAGTLMTVSSVTGTGKLGIGSVISGSGIVSASIITDFGPNTFGGVGTYYVAPSQSVASVAVTSTGWQTNFFAGRRIKITSGLGRGGEQTISSNTRDTLTFPALTTAPGLVSSSYSILQTPVKSTGTEAQWVHGCSDPNLRGSRMYVPRGASGSIDYLDITTDRFVNYLTTPQLEPLGTGTMWAYDGIDRIYFQKDNTLRFYYIDVIKNQIHGAGIAPFVNSTAIIGNRMEVYTTPDGLQYLWFVRHTSANVMRQMLFF